MEEYSTVFPPRPPAAPRPPPLTVVRADPARHRGPDARVTITSRSCLLSVLPIVDACARLDARDAD
ncbi:hypothetical protein [Nocardia cyriacigeorgica]|uniref:hypothetical protein n=1 Tax=Nocardia cyriacigeorgica TaxID=135487 RepID=UPI0024572199|nr:hypothetical protein [Nocardia cyriacigeorgica]